MVKACVVGSLNMDLVVKGPRLPQIGETVSGGTFATFPGGKGANQAVAAARLGAHVTMVGKVGQDAFGRQLVNGLRREDIDVAHVTVDPGEATGVAVIGVDGKGRNMILVASGANLRVGPGDVEDARDAIAGARVLLLQLEVPIEAVLRAAAIAKAAGALVCLDPAPAAPLPDALYASVDVIDPNEVEAQVLTGVEIRSIADAERAAAPSTPPPKAAATCRPTRCGRSIRRRPAMPLRRRWGWRSARGGGSPTRCASPLGSPGSR